MQRIILHIDFDSFFASCEQQFDPRLRGKPIGVTATNGRNCIIAASREAKRLGIKSPSRTFEAMEICPSIQFVAAHFTKYWEISQKFLSICNDFSPDVELFSLDEVFMDVSLTAALFGGTQSLISKIKKRIRFEIGEYITVSAGISYNKLLAKLASGMEKPDGVVEINRKNLDAIYQRAKLTDICGIGPRIGLRLNKIGIYTLPQLAKAPLPSLVSQFGNIEGQFLKGIGLGMDESEVISYTKAPDVKSVGRNYCLPRNEFDQRIILQNIYELCEEIGIKLRRLEKKAKTVGLSLRGTRSEAGRHSGDYTNSGQEIFRVCKKFYDDWGFENSNAEQNMVRMISVWAGNLADQKSLPLSLFERVNKNENVIKTMDAVNEKFGDHTIRRGFLWNSDKLTTVPNGWMADRFERIKLAQNYSSGSL
ncbi:MAG TPA: DNA polymerase IV [Candidatus Saccharimonadales bacterium]|nr:DNA polymerase IV [Candidatus Saccharimonadales bacterium]